MYFLFHMFDVRSIESRAVIFIESQFRTLMSVG